MKFISDRDELIHIIEAAAIRATVEATRVLAPDMHTKPDAFHYPTTLVVVFSKYVSISTAALPSAASTPSSPYRSLYRTGWLAWSQALHAEISF